MTGRSELSQRTESHSPAARDRRAASSPAGRLRLNRPDMVPSLASAEQVPPLAVPTSVTGSGSRARDWIRGFDVTPATGGGRLVVARSEATPSASGLLEVAAGAVQMPEVTINDTTVGIGQSRTGLLVAHENPADARLKTESGALVVPTEEDTKKYATGATDDQGEKTQRNSTEIAVAFEMPHLFLAREVAKRLTSLSAETANVLAMIRSQGQDENERNLATIETKSLLRDQEFKTYTSRQTGEMDGFWTTNPGPVEQVCLTAVSLLDDPEIAPQGDTVVFAPLAKLFAEYRKYTRFHKELPEMPELTAALLDRLDQFADNRLIRYGIYGMLQQLKMPFSIKNKVAQKMYETKDLDHLWAGKLPHTFITREVEKRVPTDAAEGITDVLDKLRPKNTPIPYDAQFDSTVVERKRNADDSDAPTKAGAFEQVGIALVSLLNDPSLPPHSDTHVLTSLSHLMRDYRIHTGNKAILPAMPELTAKLFNKLDLYVTDREIRNRFYGIFEQIDLPVAVQEAIVTQMDTTGDLEHPLAFELTQSLAMEDPESPWVRTQQERREQLLSLLDGTNQELFERYDELLSLSRGLVFSGDPVRPRSGKVGLEIEFKPKESITEEAKKRGMSDRAVAAEKGISRFFWEVGTDMSLLEIRRVDDPDLLEHTGEQIDSLLDLTSYLGDNAAGIGSVHFHFDRARHPFKPLLGHLISDSTRGRGSSITTVHKSTNHTTWEIRGITPPRAAGNIHPGRVEDIINLYLSATQYDTSQIAHDRHKVEIAPTNDIPSVKQLTWGHIVTFLGEPEGRLAALMALHDTHALAFVNPLSFANSYAKESLPFVLGAIEGKFDAKSDQEMIKALQIVATTDDWLDEVAKLSYFGIMREVLGVDPTYWSPQRTLVVDLEGGHMNTDVLDVGTPVVSLDIQESYTLPPDAIHRHEQVVGTGERIHTQRPRTEEFQRLHHNLRDEHNRRNDTPETIRERVLPRHERNELPNREQLYLRNEYPAAQDPLTQEMVNRTDDVTDLENARHANEEERQEMFERQLALLRQERQEEQRRQHRRIERQDNIEINGGYLRRASRENNRTEDNNT